MATRSPESSAVDAAADPLAKLHKMSTTAGVASQQYVAVNTAAVAASLLGVASALAILSPLLLVVPTAGVIVAVIALRQIGNSNGTETGKAIAALGLGLSLLLGGAVTGKELMAAAQSREDARQMVALVAQLADDVKANRFDAAYQRFSIVFRQRVDPALFADRWRVAQRPDVYGKIESMVWNGVPPQYEKADANQEMVGVIYVLIHFSSADSRFTFVFRKVGAAWQIENIVELFPDRPPPK